MKSLVRFRVVAGATDQVISAATNFLILFIAARILPPRDAGSVVLAMSVVLVAITIGRSLVGDTLLAHGSVIGEENRGRLERDALASAGVLGIASTLVALAVGLLPFAVAHDIAWVGIWMPFVLVQDTLRYIYYGRRTPEYACVVDLAWAAAQLITFLVIVLLGLQTVPWVLATWGIGGTVGAVVGVAMTRLVPFGGRVSRWFTETRHLSGWFFGQTAVSQVQNQVVIFFVAGVIGVAAAGGLRYMQNLLVLPAQTLLLATQSMLVPTFGRLLAADRLDEVRGFNRKLVVAFTVVSLVAAAVVYLIRRPLIELIFTAKFLPYAGLMLPIALATVLYAVRSPFTSACRGLQNAKGTFYVQIFYSAVTVPACIVGGVYLGVLGVAWGFTVGSAALVVSSVWVYVRTLRRLEQGPVEPAATVDPDFRMYS